MSELHATTTFQPIVALSSIRALILIESVQLIDIGFSSTNFAMCGVKIVYSHLLLLLHPCMTGLPYTVLLIECWLVFSKYKT